MKPAASARRRGRLHLGHRWHPAGRSGCCRRIERCSRAVSWVTTPMAARRLSCVTPAMSWPSIRMRPALRLEEAAAAGSPRWTCPPPNGRPARPARPARCRRSKPSSTRRRSIPAIGEIAPPRSGSRRGPGAPPAAPPPAGPARSAARRWSASPPAPRPGSRRCAVTLKATQPEMLAICQAIGSAVATAASADLGPGSRARWPVAAVPVSIAAFSSRRAAKPFSVTSRICRRKAAFSAEHPLADEGVLLRRPGEELDRQDIGVAVDDPPGQQAALLGGRARAVPHPRHQHPQQRGIGAEPDRDGHRQPPVRVPQQEQRRGAVDQDVPDRVHHLDHAFPQRRPGLHHPVGDAAREILLEEGAALADHLPMALPADQGGEIAVDALLGDQVLQQDRPRPAEQHDRRHHRAGSPPASGHRRSGAWLPSSATSRPIMAGMAASSSATSSPATKSAAKSSLRLADEVPVEAGQAARRRRLRHRRAEQSRGAGARRGDRIDQSFEEAEGHSGTTPGARRQVKPRRAMTPPWPGADQLRRET